MLIAKSLLIAFISIALLDLYSDQPVVPNSDDIKPPMISAELAKKAYDFVLNSSAPPDYQNESEGWVMLGTKHISFPIAQGEEGAYSDKRSWIRLHGWTLTIVFKADRYLNISRGLITTTYGIWDGKGYNVVAMLYENIISEGLLNNKPKVDKVGRTAAKIGERWYVNYGLYSPSNIDTDIRPISIDFDSTMQLDPIRIKFVFKSIEGDKEFYINIVDKNGNSDNSPRIGL